MSCTGANAVTTKDRGETTHLSSAPSCQAVRMESESFPTGIDKPASMQNSDTALTVS